MVTDDLPPTSVTALVTAFQLIGSTRLEADSKVVAVTEVDHEMSIRFLLFKSGPGDVVELRAGGVTPSGTFAVSVHLTHELTRGSSTKVQGPEMKQYENDDEIMDSGLFKNNGIQHAFTRNFDPATEPAPFGGIIMRINSYSVQRSGALSSPRKGKREEHGLAVSRTKPGQHPVQCGRRNHLAR